MTAQQFGEMMDAQEFIDNETGEVVGRELGTITANDLPQLGRAIRALRLRIETIRKYRDDEVRRIVALCEAKTQTAEETIAYLTARAEGLMNEAGEKRLAYPGIGTFRFQPAPLAVDSTEYDEADEDTQTQIRATAPDLFSVNITVRPDKKAIRALIEDGAVVPGFRLRGGELAMRFVAE